MYTYHQAGHVTSLPDASTHHTTPPPSYLPVQHSPLQNVDDSHVVNNPRLSPRIDANLQQHKQGASIAGEGWGTRGSLIIHHTSRFETTEQRTRTESPRVVQGGWASFGGILSRARLLAVQSAGGVQSRGAWQRLDFLGLYVCGSG